jgi:autotransporter-associated beta strand protein
LKTSIINITITHFLPTRDAAPAALISAKLKVFNQELVAPLPILLAMLVLVCTFSTQAATSTKQPTGTDLTGNTAGVWSGGGGISGSPGSGDVATWNSASLGAGLTLTNSASWGGISVAGALTDIDVSGTGTLTNGSSGINIPSSAVNITLGTPVVLSASQTWVPSQTAGKTLTVSGNVSGSSYGLTVGTVPKSGPGTQQGTILLSGAVNSFSSAILDNGTLVLTNGQTTITNITINQWNNSKLINTGLYVTNGGTLIFNSLAISTQNSGSHVTPAVYFDNGTLESAGTATIGSGLSLKINPSGLTVNTVGGNITSSSAFVHGGGSPDGGLTVTGGNVLALPSGSTFTGGTRINAGTVSLASGTSLGSSGTIEFTGNSTLQWGSGVTTDLSSRLQLDDGITATIDTGANNVSFANALTLGAAGTGGLNKQGAGTLTLSAANTYTGNTTINAGTLALNSDNAIANSANISVAAGAVLDVSALTDGTLNLGTSQTLSGLGTVLGSVNVSGVLAPDPGIGTLTVTNVANLAGTLAFKLNRTNSPATNGQLVATSIIAGGSLIVTNLGPDLITGSSYKLFSVPVTGSFATVELPLKNATGSITYIWTNKLAIDGSIQLLAGASPVNTAPTNLFSSFSNGVLALSWPADHTGWRLQVQTNTTGTGLGTNWVTVPNSTLVNSNNITVNSAAGAVFYRLVYP